MTTKVPQDVIELAKQAGFDVDDDGDIWGSENGSLLRFAELLRAQRQQGAEPVGWAYEFHEFGDVWARAVILNRPDGGANPPTKHYGSSVRSVTPLYATTPQANALVAAAYRKAAEIVREKGGNVRAIPLAACPAISIRDDRANQWEEAADLILSTIPADAEAALREVSEKLAEAIKGAFKDEIASAKHFNVPGVADALEAFQDTVVTFAVNSVLGEGGK
jgi:hypothetical protein